MALCFFVSDLHGSRSRYLRLLERVEAERPAAVFFGGDLLPGFAGSYETDDFLDDFLFPQLRALKRRLGQDYPRGFLILGNDDPRIMEEAFRQSETEDLFTLCHARWDELDGHPVLGYAMVPPTPFGLKDWERYDVSRGIEPGAISPEEGHRTVKVSPSEVRYGTIQKDLETLCADKSVSQAIVLCHAPPYQTVLDRAALDGKMVDYVPLDVHVGSIALQRFIEARQPLLTLHGHVHESARLTGHWRTRIGSTHCFSAAHDGLELALVRFDPAHLDLATRELLPVS